MKKSLFAFSFAALANFGLSAQEFPYAFSTYNETYTPLGESTNLLGDELWDDPEVFIPIGFDFTIFGNTTNELLLLPPGSQLVTGIIKGSVTDVMVPYLGDVMNASITEPVSPILYSLEGTPGDLIFKLQWTNVGFYDEFFSSESFSNTTNFQVWIYQNGNIVEYRFGDNTIKSPDVIHFFGAPICLIGNAVALDGSSWGGMWAVTGDPSNPNLIAVPSGLQEFTDEYLLNGEPASGTVYRFGEIPSNVTEEQKQDIVLWPNPATDAIRIIASSNQQYWVYDQLGKQVLTGKMINDNHDIDLSNLQSGTYIIRTESGLAKQFIKL
ncbi:MAG: T9SS type A sorting domain-containing protein [Flavobacteriales bacterium]|jgi:hypothetical protein